MGKLGFILGGVALAATGYGLKKWYDKTKEENAYWTDDPKDIACEMLGQAAEKVYNAVDDKFFNEPLIVSDLFGRKETIENNPELKEKYEQTCTNIKEIFENANPNETKEQKLDNVNN
ncbi:hypothetical protein FPD38_04665 [Campylobacter volucris]|uniref:Uncharacterized protein n=1 Tax=Campylobacter volucris TaxID=1031542 RepID=A0A5C7DU73_9BACT|nr:hypothetical protein [Campylobacter volucris]TXE88132.1 hypothetical protein FPD38_04665 [Campylobacter volucris]